MEPWTDGFFALICILQVFLPCTDAFFCLTAREPALILTADFEANTRDMQFGMKSGSVDLCNALVLQRKQKRYCLIGPGVAETLLRACRLSANECQYQFQNERWSCPLLDHRKQILKRGFKEVSFMFAVSSAGLVHELARACALGLIDRCTCDESEHLENTETWRWGGCGDNIRFGMRFARNFLQEERRRSGKDVRAMIDEHNNAVGISTVKHLVHTKCKCHGVSGSCAVKTCWLQLSPFIAVGGALKRKYEKAVRVVSLLNQVTETDTPLKGRNNLRDALFAIEGADLAPLRKSELTYIENSPNFCQNSSYSPGTSGRLCAKGGNCEEMCCGRGHNVEVKVFKTNCKCETVWCCQITCKTCLVERDVLLCK